LVSETHLLLLYRDRSFLTGDVKWILKRKHIVKFVFSDLKVCLYERKSRNSEVRPFCFTLDKSMASASTKAKQLWRVLKLPVSKLQIQERVKEEKEKDIFQPGSEEDATYLTPQSFIEDQNKDLYEEEDQLVEKRKDIRMKKVLETDKTPLIPKQTQPSDKKLCNCCCPVQ